jgi:capsular exopolysaccharide synthesis family protein
MNDAHSSRVQPEAVGQAARRLGPHETEGQRHVLDRLSVLYRQRYVAVCTFMVVLVVAALHSYSQPALYRASTRLLFEVETDPSLGLEAAAAEGVSENLDDPEPYFQTQFRILAGRELARRVVRRADLASLREFSDPPSPSAAVPGAATTAEDALIDGFLSHVSIQRLQASRLVDVSIVSVEPETAVRLADALAEEYVDGNLAVRRQNLTRSLEWLAGELASQERKLEASERALARYRDDHDALSLDNHQNIVVARLNQLNDAVTRARTSRVQKESLYRQIATLDVSGSADAMPAVLQSGSVQTVKARLADLRRERADLAERYGERHPSMVAIDASIDDVSRQLAVEVGKARDALRNDYQSALIEERALGEDLEDQKTAAMDLNHKSVRYVALEREAHSNRRIYETLLQREKELQVLVNSRGNNVRLVERARVPRAPFSPDHQRDLVRAGLIALVAAWIIAVGRDYLDDTIKTPDDVVHRLRLPYLGLVPVRDDAARQPISASAVPSDFGESVRALRTALVLTHSAPGAKIVLVTSARPLEGKTTVATNLAVSLAHGGARVLLIDADMRRPSVHQRFALSNRRGLSDLLDDRAAIGEVVQRLSAPDLWVLPAGSAPDNPSELLASRRMKELLDHAHEGPFDWVLIDSPPVLAVTDAIVLAPSASGVAFVVGCEMTECRQVEQAIRALAVSRPRHVGAVLNRVDLSRDRFYYSRYYGYRADDPPAGPRPVARPGAGTKSTRPNKRSERVIGRDRPRLARTA